MAGGGSWRKRSLPLNIVPVGAENSMYKHKKTSGGFTLVELLVVIAIIGVLATLVLLQLGTARAKARDTKRIADINQIRSAVELYFDDNGLQYPTAITIANLGKYIAQPTMPADPVTGAGYFYAHNPTAPSKAVQFHLWAELEQKNASALNGDSDICSAAGAAPCQAAAWTGDAIDASAPGTSEACAAAYAAGVARDCIFDTGQK